MQDNPQKQSPIFAEVQINGIGQNRSQSARSAKENFRYFKLTYPNGVTLTLPTEIEASKLETFIRIKV